MSSVAYPDVEVEVLVRHGLDVEADRRDGRYYFANLGTHLTSAGLCKLGLPTAVIRAAPHLRHATDWDAGRTPRRQAAKEAGRNVPLICKEE